MNYSSFDSILPLVKYCDFIRIINPDMKSAKMKGEVFMRKKLAVLVLAASMLTFCVACGDKDDDKKTEATTEATTAATEAETTAAASSERAELDNFHGIFTVTYDPNVYKLPEASDLADLIAIDPTKNTNLFISTLDGLDFVEEKMDNLKKYDTDPEEIKVGDYEGYLFEYDDDLMGHTLEYIISLENEVKSSDGYYNNVAGIYIHGADSNKDAIANDETRNIINSVKIGDFASTDEDVEDVEDKDDDSDDMQEETHDDYGKSNPDATGIVTKDKLKETFDWLRSQDPGTYPTYEECKEHFGADGAPWFDGAFDDEKHAYKWETEDKSDFLYITFKVEDGNETYWGDTYSSGLKDQ